MVHNSNLPPHFWAEAVTAPTEQDADRANDSVMLFECFYRMKPDVGHIRTFRCIMHVTLFKEMLGKLEDHGATGYQMGHKYDGGYHVWIPCIGVKEVRDITFYEGTAPVLPNHGSAIEVQHNRVQVAPLLETRRAIGQCVSPMIVECSKSGRNQ